jgi:hypothetical protein
MAFSGSGSSSSAGLGLGEPGGRRKRLAGYLKSANEMRQSYFGGEANKDGHDDVIEDGPGAFPDAAVIRSGNEEMILFPSYARRHVKSKVS